MDYDSIEAVLIENFISWEGLKHVSKVWFYGTKKVQPNQLIIKYNAIYLNRNVNMKIIYIYTVYACNVSRLRM